MTRNGIEYDLPKSPYIYNYNKDNYNIYFYFSSLFNLNRYEEGYIDFVYCETLKFKNKYKINPFNEYYKNLFITFMLVYYMKIEKRGFYITYVNELGKICVIDKDNDVIKLKGDY